MKQVHIVSIAAVVIAIGAAGYYFGFDVGFEKNARDGESPLPSNAEALKREGGLEITTSEPIYYGSTKGYYVAPKKAGSYPGVILIHENRGLRPEIRATAEQLAGEGYLVLAVDLLGSVVETQDQARALTADYNQQTGTANMRAAAAYLRGKGATKVASLGWCFGGGQSLQLALSGEKMDATIIYYGRLVTTAAELSPIKWPVLGIFGGADQSITVESVNQFRAALDSLRITNEIYIYPNVGHAFANPSGANYAPSETKAAWERTLAFLTKHLDN